MCKYLGQYWAMWPSLRPERYNVLHERRSKGIVLTKLVPIYQHLTHPKILTAASCAQHMLRKNAHKGVNRTFLGGHERYVYHIRKHFFRIGMRLVSYIINFSEWCLSSPEIHIEWRQKAMSVHHNISLLRTSSLIHQYILIFLIPVHIFSVCRPSSVCRW